MMNAEIKKVRISETDMEYSTPSKPKNIGRSSAKPTPNTTLLAFFVLILFEEKGPDFFLRPLDLSESEE